MKRNVSLSYVAIHISMVKVHSDTVKGFLANTLHTRAPHQHPHGANPNNITRRRNSVSVCLLRPSPAEMQQIFCRIGQVLYGSKALLTQITNITSNQPKSTQNSRIEAKHFGSQTLIQHIKLIFHPFSKQNISACLGELDLHIHGKKLAKREDQFSTYLR